ncbi:MAG: cysteine hydrolase family protein [Gammaproteobacteria bacterium]
MTPLTLDTRPEALDIDLAMTAVIVVDMQNAFASRGGLLDLAGVDIGGANAVVRTIGGILDAARGARVLVVYLQTGYKPDLSNGGGPASPNPRKETALCLMRARPELKGQLLVEGTWDFQIIDALAPQAATIFNVESFFGWTLNSRTLIDALGAARAT